METNETIIVKIKFGGRLIPIEISSDSTVNHLKSLLQPLTNVLPRGQRLIFKGKVLIDEMTFSSSGITNGAKIMLIGSEGLHQGDGPIKEHPRSKWAVTTNRRNENEDSISNTRRERWRHTGIIGLSECNLKIIPADLWDCAGFVKFLDLSHNSIEEIPGRISLFGFARKLLLNANDLLDTSISWGGISSLKLLTVLSLSQNQLTTLPGSVGALTCLEELHIANNKITSIPTEIGALTKLKVLKANNNRICHIPASLGGCISLVEVDFSCNLLVELPETVGHLKDLKALYLNNNGLKSLPGTLFKMCSQLSILDLHGTEITVDLLRQLEGWESFDQRRRQKHQKQLDFRVTSSAEFDEGADKNW